MTKVTTPPVQSKSNVFTDGISVEVVTITPDIARRWLESTDMTKQRRVNWPHVAYLAEEMRSGNWELNGQAIQIDVEDDVVNGIHRLNACIESGVSFRSLVVFDVSTDAIKTIDEGSKPRTLSDFLEIEYNCKYSTETAAAMQFIYQWDMGRKGRAAVGGPENNQNGKAHNGKMSPSAAQNFLEENPGFFQFIEDALSVHRAGDKLVTGRIFCGMLWIIGRENPVKAESFFAKLSTGTNIQPKSPMAYLRKKLTENAMSDRPLFSPAETVAFIVKAFNYYVEGVENVHSMRIPNEVPEIAAAKRA